MTKTNRTGKVYDEIFGDHHTDEVVVDLTRQILTERFSKWFKDINWFADKIALDVSRVKVLVLYL